MLFIYRLSGDLLLRKIDELLLRKIEDCKLLLTNEPILKRKRANGGLTG